MANEEGKKSGKVMKAAKKIAVAASIAAVLTVGTKGYLMYAHSKAVKADIIKEVATMDSCQVKGQETSGCLEPERLSYLKDAAAKYEKIGHNREAGLIYARLGMETEALKLADKCEKDADKSGSAEIKEKIEVRAKALEIYSNMPQKKETPKPESSK